MSKKSLFNFYLDDDDKDQAIKKLERLLGDKPKGALASYLRVCIKRFILLPDDKISKELIDAIDAEFEYNKSLNKRSNL